MRRVLIDANVYLELYRFSRDDLEELRKLAELIRTKEIELYISQQLRDEFRRNRERVLAQSFKTVTDAKVPTAFPQVLRNYHQFSKLDAARQSLTTAIDDLLARAREDASQRKLPADELLDELMGLATDLLISDQTVDAAKSRFDRGNPPGKDRSYGDAITWEALLAHHPMSEPLDLITSDVDYLSPLRTNELHEFLEVEWTEAKCSSVALYENLTAFLQAHYPDIKLSTEVAGEVAVTRLESSGSFASTHAAIATLHRMADFSPDQVQRLITAALENSQISMILLDEDVHEVYEWLLDTFGDDVEATSREELRRMLAEDAD